MTTDQQPNIDCTIAWTIAGSDSGGGAGIQADLHTFQNFGVHGCSVITALTAQNSTGVQHIAVTEKESLAAQIHALDQDLPAKAIKLGMLANTETINAVTEYLNNYQGFVVYDPVMQSSSGQSLLEGSSQEKSTRKNTKGALDELWPHIDLLTPNIPEAEALTGLTIETTEHIALAAEKLLAMGVRSVFITGGHFQSDQINHHQCLDYWSDGNESFWLTGEKIDTANSHGSGCTLSSAIAAAMALGHELWDALIIAKAYVTQGIRHSFQYKYQLGSGPGPVSHCGFPTSLEDLPRLIKQPDLTTLNFPNCDGELGLYPVVDSLEWLEKLIPLGITTIQLRIKQLQTKDQPSDLSKKIQQAVALANKYQVRLFINDYWQLAIEHQAYGVHLGQEDLDTADLNAIKNAGLRLGVSTHSYYEIARAHAIEPSYIAIGPIYPTKTKVMKFSERGLERLSEWVQLLKPHYTMTAIGGINVERCHSVLNTGVKSCAMVTAITEAEDYQQVVKLLLEQHQNF